MFAFGTDIDSKDLKKILKKAKNIIGDDSALTAGSGKSNLDEAKGKIGILDLGAKASIINVLQEKNFDTVLIDPKTKPEEILSLELSGLLISNGPGDPRSLTQVIENINKKLTLVEKIKKIQLIDENFSIENGLLTPTMKVKRKKVTEKYKKELENLY